MRGVRLGCLAPFVHTPHLTTSLNQKGYVFLQWADPCEELVESLISSSSDDSLSLPSLSLGVLSSPVN